jgi:hypothetical protein
MTGRRRRFLISLRGPLKPVAEPGRKHPGPLIVCGRCGAHLVNPVNWHESGDSEWWVRLRCGACGDVREEVIGDAEAQRLEQDLAFGLGEIERSARRLERERVASQDRRFGRGQQARSDRPR